MDIAIIGGTGDMGYGLALRLARKGHNICIGSRQEEKALEAAERARGEAGVENIRGTANPEACAGQELIVISVPSQGHRATLESLKEAIGDTPVLDITIPIGFNPLRYAPPEEGSNALETKALLGEASKVSAGFHTISAELLCDLSHPITGDLLVVGDDDPTVQVVLGLGEEIGLRAFHAGSLVHSPTVESLIPMLIGMNRRYGKRHIGISLSGV